MTQNNTYYYAIHVIGWEGSRRRVKQCYLGPEKYIYVEKTTNPLSLSGYLDTDRFLRYVTQAINSYIVSATAKRKPEKLTNLLNVLKGLEEEIKKQLEVLGQVSS